MKIICILSLALLLVLGNANKANLKCSKTSKLDNNLKDVSKWLKSLFTAQDNCEAFITKELDDWGILLKEGESVDPNKVKIKLSDVKKDIDSPSAHIDKIVNCANQNPYLVQAVKDGRAAFLADYNSWDTAKKAKFSEVNKTAVCYSNFLSLMTIWIESDYPRSKIFFNQLNAFIAKFAKIDIKGLRWYNYMDSFGNIKTNTVFLMMNGMMDDMINRQSLAADKKKCGVRMNRISLNIAEAMYYDAKAGYMDNALTGSALVVTPAYEKVDVKLETEPSKFSEGGVYQVFQPFPDQWADLYSVWNLSFTAGEMEDFPMYWAKLLTPGVGCYRAIKGSYLFNRAINLAMHIVHQLIAKNLRKNNSPGFDVRSKSFVTSFGKSNKASADAYIKKVQDNDTDAASKERRLRKLEETNNVVKSIPNGTFSILKSLYSIVSTECFEQEVPAEEKKGFISGLWSRITGKSRRRNN